ncbi:MULTISPECIES: hypothetical protein [Burkholderia cepacia complex]|uniref:hypothetical protein n=1 Tax=Burkholderia cepacia complex TaxID=87882 RepID=UPI00157AD642|nr:MULTISPECIES: hypothetical protein [Burkholderia cepacia complex]NTY40619.1 hypothetical protein [Burkholderia diffusa]
MSDSQCPGIAAGSIPVRRIAAGEERANFLDAGSSLSPEKLSLVRACRAALTREYRQATPLYAAFVGSLGGTARIV